MWIVRLLVPTLDCSTWWGCGIFLTTQGYNLQPGLLKSCQTCWNPNWLLLFRFIAGEVDCQLILFTSSCPS